MTDTPPGKPTRAEALAELLASPPRVHLDGAESWALEPGALDWLAAALEPEWRTVETGCGSSSIVFTLVGTEHTVIAPNQAEHDEIRRWCEARGFATSRTTSIVEDSTKVLPSLRGEFDLGLIDGGHAFPLPFIDWLYIADRLRLGGLLIVDDINLPTCGILHDFLAADEERWTLERRFPRSSMFRKLAEPVVSVHDWTGQPWVLAELRRQRRLRDRLQEAIRDPRAAVRRAPGVARRALGR